MDLRFYLGVFARRWWIIVLATLLVSGFSYVRLLRDPTAYSTASRLLYENNSIALSVLSSSGMYMPLSWNNPVDTQVKLVNTRPNVEEVIHRLNLRYPNGDYWVADKIMQSIDTEIDKDTDIIVIKYLAYSPDHALDIVNTLSQVFVERNRSYTAETATSTRKFVEDQLGKTEKRLNDAEDALRNFRETHQTFDVSGLGSGVGGEISTADKAMTELEVEQAVAQAKIDDAKRHLEITQPDVMKRLEKLKADGVYQALQGDLAKADADVTLQRAQYTDGSPEVKQAESTLNKLRAAMQVRVKLALGRELSNQDLETARTPTEEKYTGDLAAAETDLAIDNARHAAYERSHAEAVARFKPLPAAEQEFNQLLRQQKAAEETYNVFLKKEQEMKITEAMNVGSVHVVEPATHVAATAKPYTKVVSLASLMGVLFGLGVALLIEFLDDRIRRPEEAQNVLELPILGLLPWIDGREAEKKRLVVLEDPRSPVTESYRALQTYTRMVEPDSHHQCFLVTSPGPKEGKSTVLANLAITAAQLGKRTLVVDTDLRAPSQHINFDRPNLVGLYDVVYEGAPLDEALQPTEVPNLDVLCTGPVPPDPVQTLHSDSFKRMLESLKRDYDVIFFDSPPINLFTDAAVLGREMDSVLLVVDVRSTTRQSTLTAKDLLLKAKVPLSGMVVKNMAHQSSKYHERYYERYYMDRLHHLADE